MVVERTETRAFGHAPTESRMIQGGVLRIESTCPALVVGRCKADYRITMPENGLRGFLGELLERKHGG